MNSNKFIELISIEAKEMAQAFRKASIEGCGTPQEIADRREECFKKFFGKYFPFPYRIVKGNIIDAYGNNSNSIDCIVLNPCHPYTIDPTNDKASVIFADGVDYAIEIKSDLSNRNEIERALIQIQSVKKLRRKKLELLFPDRYTPEQIECHKTIPCMIIADKTFSDYGKLISVISSFYQEHSVPPLEQFDLLLVNNDIVVYNFRNGSYYSCDREGLALYEAGGDSLALFLYEMNKLPHCEPELGNNIIRIYLESLRPDELVFYTPNSL